MLRDGGAEPALQSAAQTRFLPSTVRASPCPSGLASVPGSLCVSSESVRASRSLMGQS